MKKKDINLILDFFEGKLLFLFFVIGDFENDS